MIGYCSPGIRRIKALDALLDAPSTYFFRTPGREVTHIAGWGYKPTADKARRIAAEQGLPYIGLEDGFLRSLELGVTGAPALSLVVDYSGIYYDATRPSDLETLIAEMSFADAELARARECMRLLRKNRLSKYNHAPDTAIVWPDDRPRVLVVDQTEGDVAVELGLASAGSFAALLKAAIREHPDAEVCVKVHPDVIAGKKRGYLLSLAREHGCRLLSEDISPWAVLDAVQEVYVVTSQFGFDALLAGKPVHCFGLPFYAGWGLTRDRVACERRGVRRSLEQVFAAAYLRYCRYVNPYTGARCELEDTIRLIADQKRLRSRLSGSWLGAGFSPWKRQFVPAFLGRPKDLRFIPKQPDALSAVKADINVAVWASSLEPEFAQACAQAGLCLWRMEDGFLRSVGLGADLVAPLSLVVDSGGIYYDARSPCDLESLLRDTDFDGDLLARARSLRRLLVAKGVSKYNVGASDMLAGLDIPANRRVILVPGQVETDASIAAGSPWLKTNLALLQAVRAANPDAFIIYKPHPDVAAGARLGALDTPGTHLFDALIEDVSMPALLDMVDEVHTLSSLTGFEALLRERKVVTYGLPFYAGWGLSEDRLLLEDIEGIAFDRATLTARRARRLSLDELVAGVLILYPVYVDPASGDHIDAETAIGLLERARVESRAPGLGVRLYRWYRNRFLRR